VQPSVADSLPEGENSRSTPFAKPPGTFCPLALPLEFRAT
jgi:hypothetical protein